MPEAASNPTRRAWRRFLRNRAALVGGVVLVVILLAALAGPLLSAHDPNRASDLAFATPGRTHWLGTDIHGRDLLTRTLVGTRISLLVGLTGAAVSVVIGVAWGLVAAYSGGRVDAVMMRTVDILYALPNIIFVMLVIGLTEALLIRWLQSVAPSFAGSAHSSCSLPVSGPSPGSTWPGSSAARSSRCATAPSSWPPRDSVPRPASSSAVTSFPTLPA